MHLTIKDLEEGAAFIRYSKEGKLQFLHDAGAPWNDQDPKAQLSKLQVECLEHEEREKIIHGGSGVGKSVLGACEALLEISLPNRKMAIVAANYRHCHKEFKYIYDGFRKVWGVHMANELKCVARPQTFHMEIDTIWGSNCGAISTERDDGSALLGSEYDLLVLGEGSHVKQDILNKKIWRALDRRIKQFGDNKYSRKTGRLVIFTTPKSYDGCSAAEWERVLDAHKGQLDGLALSRGTPWEQSVWLREANCLENPSYNMKIFEAARKKLPADAFAEQYEGKMIRRSGLVYKEYNEGLHTAPMPTVDLINRMRLGIGIDTGKHFAAVLTGVDMTGHIWLLGEVRASEQLTSENCDDIKFMIVEVLGPVYGVEVETDNPDLRLSPDSYRKAINAAYRQLQNKIDMWVIDPASQQKEDIADELDVGLEHYSQELLPSIDKVRSFFGLSEITVVEEIISFVREIKKYTWEEKRQRTALEARPEPRKGNDHLLDAFRFVVIPLDQEGPLATPKVSVNIYEAMREAQRKSVVEVPEGHSSHHTFHRTNRPTRLSGGIRSQQTYVWGNDE